MKDKAYGVVSVIIPVPVFICFCGFSVYKQVAVRIAVKPAYNIQKRGFAAARMTEYLYKFAFSEFNADALKRVYGGIARNIILFDIL